MATIKAYTDLEQSKKLAGILPIESADMWYQCTGISIKDGSKKPIYFPMVIRDDESDEDIPCWSLTALLGVFPYYEINNNGVNIQLSVKGEALITEKGEELLDLVVNMIIHLHELKML